MEDGANKRQRRALSQPSSLSGLEKQLRRNRITHCFCSRPINEAIPDPVVCRFFGVFVVMLPKSDRLLG